MLDLDNEQDATFTDSETGSFLDRPLNSYSYKAERAAYSLGLRIGTSKVLQSDIRAVPNAGYARKRELEKLKGKKRTQAVIDELESLGEQDPEIEVYDGMGEDAAIIVFVRTLKVSELAELRSRITTYTDRFEEWVEANGLRTNGPNVKSAMRIFNETMAQLRASRSQPVVPDAKGGEDSPNG